MDSSELVLLFLLLLLLSVLFLCDNVAVFHLFVVFLSLSFSSFFFFSSSYFIISRVACFRVCPGRDGLSYLFLRVFLLGVLVVFLVSVVLSIL